MAAWREKITAIAHASSLGTGSDNGCKWAHLLADPRYPSAGDNKVTGLHANKCRHTLSAYDDDDSGW